MKNRTVFVTGAGQGIGLAISTLFAQKGARVIAADINSIALERIQNTPGISTLQLDITDMETVSKLGETYSEIDTLINCAGYVSTGSIVDCQPEEFQKSFEINLLGMYSLIKQMLPNMLGRKQGAIINLASTVSTIKAAPDRFAYSVFKGGVLALTKSIALDFIKDGIRCNAISPGTIDSPSLHERLKQTGDYEKAYKTFTARQPMGRLGLPQEVAETALFLASYEASFLTGENIIIDGGFTL